MTRSDGVMVTTEHRGCMVTMTSVSVSVHSNIRATGTVTGAALVPRHHELFGGGEAGVPQVTVTGVWAV